MPPRIKGAIADKRTEPASKFAVEFRPDDPKRGEGAVLRVKQLTVDKQPLCSGVAVRPREHTGSACVVDQATNRDVFCQLREQASTANPATSDFQSTQVNHDCPSTSGPKFSEDGDRACALV